MSAAAPLAEVNETQLQLHTARSRTNDFVLYGCVALLLFGPLAFGAVEAWASFVLETTAAILATVWCARQIRSGSLVIAWNPVFLPMSVFGLVVVIQLVAG